MREIEEKQTREIKIKFTKRTTIILIFFISLSVFAVVSYLKPLEQIERFINSQEEVDSIISKGTVKSSEGDTVLFQSQDGWRVVSNTGFEEQNYDVEIIGDIVCLSEKTPILRGNETLISGEKESMKLVSGSGTLDTTLTKDGEGKFCYTLDKGEPYYTFGSSSVVIEGDTSYNSVDLDVTQEVGYAHLNMSQDDLYADLVYYLPFDENFSSTTRDFSDSNLDGTMGTETSIDSVSPFGNGIRFSSFDTNSRITLPVFTAFSPSFSYSLWINRTSTYPSQALGTFISGQLGAGAPHFLSNESGGLSVNKQGIIIMGTSQDKFVTEGVFTHVGVTYNGSLVKFYINGINVTHVTPADPVTFTDEPRVIGIKGDNALERFNGTIDEVMVFSDELNTSNMLLIYLNQSARFSSVGTQKFENINLSVDGNENTANVSLEDYVALFGSNISAGIGESPTYQNLSLAGVANEFSFSGDPNYQNITFIYSSGTDDFYSPLMIGNITLDSYTTPLTLVINDPTTENPKSVSGINNFSISFNISDITSGVTMENVTVGGSFADILGEEGIAGDSDIQWASSHLAGTASDPNNANGASDATFTTDVSDTDWTSRWAMGNTLLTPSGTQTINVVARETANGGGNPTIEVNLYENGVLDSNLVVATILGDDTGAAVNIIGTFDASAIVDPDDIEIEVVVLGAGGGPNKDTIQIDSINWTVESPSSPSTKEFSYVPNEGWQVNVTVPTGFSGLQDLFLNATYLGTLYSSTETNAINYGGADTCTYGGSGDWDVTCSDNCVVTSYTDVTGDLLLDDTVGEFRVQANLSVDGIIDKTGLSCKIVLHNDNGSTIR